MAIADWLLDKSAQARFNISIAFYVTLQLQISSLYKRFLEKCLDKDLIPEGLRIKLEPQDFMSSQTNIRE